ncbi:MAG: tRNA wybutosine-synthesizing 3 family protein [Nanoarchaeota archaeon]
MSFMLKKQGAMLRIDRSKKGGVDEEIKELLACINARPEYFTTSSCAGRILVIQRKSERKIDAEWLLASHRPVDVPDVRKAIVTAAYPAWFRMEPVILHVCASTLDSAMVLLRMARDAGLKRSGIMSLLNGRIMIELCGNDILDTIVHDGRRMVVDDSYLTLLVDEANKKLKRNKKRIDLLVKRMN